MTIGSESMHIDSTQVTMHRTEHPFKYFGPAIVGNIVSYSSSSEEEEIKSQGKKKDEGVSVEKVVEK